MNEIIVLLIGALTSGGLTWMFTIKSTRKQAQAEAMEKVQNVYQELIEDLKADREELRNENQNLKDTIRSLNDRLSQLEDQCKENARRYDSLKPFVCYFPNCPNRKLAQ